MSLKKLERYLRVNLLGPGPSSYKKNIYRAAVSQRLRNKGWETLVYNTLAEAQFFKAESLASNFPYVPKMYLQLS
jgi:hypothetical protein